MNDWSESLSLLLGAAHAAVFGVFLVAAAGKLAGCRPGLRPMCVKGSVDAALALLACLVFLPIVPQIGAAAAIVIGAGGWLRERISRNTVCNCFGVLTNVFHPWRNGARIILVGGGAVALALSPRLDPAAPGLWSGAALGLSVLLAGAALVLARSPLLRKPVVAAAATPVMTIAAGTISPATVVGSDDSGRAVRLQELLTPGAPLPLLVTAAGCQSCDSLKAELAPLLPQLPFRMFGVLEDEHATPASPHSLRDPQRQFRKTLGVKTVPCLILIDEQAGNLARPVAMGTEAIKGELLRMLLLPKRGADSEAPALAA